jgi:hypothetical protein
MYSITEEDGYLLVKFEDDFDYAIVRTIIHHVTKKKEYPCTNDIWMIGKYHARIRLGEVETMVQDFHCQCPSDATRTKTAIVAEREGTQTILELWVHSVKKRVPFDLKIFYCLEEAKEWLGVADFQLS